ncbi:hypothetical protein ACFYTF_29110 [Nocardia thailandica]|uniref:DUF2613 domain-containing protein n=1 Tax=Nocardia thailandica TaxID=257275 RepID=A0ABW6PWU1_9NOCA
MIALLILGGLFIGCICVAGAAVITLLAAYTSSGPVLTPELEEGPAAGDAAGLTNFHP